MNARTPHRSKHGRACDTAPVTERRTLNTPRQHRGFTLLELLIALALGLLLLLIAIPSVSGMNREKKLRATFEEFENFVRLAQSRALTNRRTYVMVWDKDGIDLVPLDPTAPDTAPVLTTEGVNGAPVDEAPEQPNFFPFSEEAKWTMQRPAALVKNAIWEWPFWRSGLCEPAVVSYESEAGSWVAEYSGLTGRGRVLEMDVK